MSEVPDAMSDAAGACSSEGVGTLALTIEIPTGVDAKVNVESEDAEQLVTASQEIEIAAGEHRIRAERVTVAGTRVGSAYYPEVTETTACVQNETRTEVTIRYTLEPGSQRLWVLRGNNNVHTASFAASDLEATGTPSPASTLSKGLTNPSTLAFDRDGNLWIGEGNGRVISYARDSLGAPRSDAPEIVLEGDAVCEPNILPCGPSSMAFDAEGNLWVTLRERVVKIARTSLLSSGKPPAAVTLSGPSILAPEALAFARNGDLWIANGEDSSIARFARARLSGNDANAADTILFGEEPPPVVIGLGSPSTLAFDADENLWVGYFGPNVLARYTPPEQAMSMTLRPQVQLKVGVLALVEDLAFDDAGDLWLTGKQGQIARIAKSQLAANADITLGGVTVTIADQGYAQALAFDPPGAGTPIAR